MKFGILAIKVPKKSEVTTLVLGLYKLKNHPDPYYYSKSKQQTNPAHHLGPTTNPTQPLIQNGQRVNPRSNTRFTVHLLPHPCNHQTRVVFTTSSPPSSPNLLPSTSQPNPTSHLMHSTPPFPSKSNHHLCFLLTPPT